MGIDVEHDFQPEYVVYRGQEEGHRGHQGRAQEGREGPAGARPRPRGLEAIAWHIAEEIRPANPNISTRALQRDHKRRPVNDAILHPLELDMHKFESQQARPRARPVGGLRDSALCCGPRCGAVCRRAGCNRWPCRFGRGIARPRSRPSVPRVVLDHRGAGGKAAHRPFGRGAWSGCRARRPCSRTKAKPARSCPCCRRPPCGVTAVERKERRKNPPPPFITSRLQQKRPASLRFSPKRTMGLAQRLYEGVELGDEGPTGLITYMRTDSTGCPRTRSRTCARGR